MITAEEAKALYDKSGEEVRYYLTHTIEPAVVKSATAGHRDVFIYIDAAEVNRTPKADAHQMAVMTELKKSGYKVGFGSDGMSYVPRGLANDDGTGPSYMNYGFHIGW